MSTQHKEPVAIIAGLPGPRKRILPNSVLSEQRGTGRVHGPEQGYRRCERRYPNGRLRTQRSR